MKFKRIVLFLVLSLLLCETSLLSEDYEDLRNIGNEFQILIERLGKSEAKIGLTENRLKTVTELRLRREGMKVVSGKEVSVMNESDGTPLIYVNAHVIRKSFSIRLEVKEWVGLKRIPLIHEIFATTWHKAMIGTHGENPEFIVSSLNQLFDEFFNDYYKANPKEKKEVRENEL